MNNFILIGFDRSGTSAISRTLAMHPDIELIFRPFNSGPIRKKMYQILKEENVSSDDKVFFSNLENNKLDSSYFVSQWHEKFSTVQSGFKKGKTHVIITNINHFSVRWVQDCYPKIEQWAIWRNPEEILNSCIKNKFYGDWYSDALEQVFKAVLMDEELSQLFKKWIKLVEQSDYVIKTAFLIAVRNYFLFKNIEKNKIIDYEFFKRDPNAVLLPVLNYFELNNDFDFNKFLSLDLNSIPSIDGYKANKKAVNVIRNKDMEIAQEMFEPLKQEYILKTRE